MAEPSMGPTLREYLEQRLDYERSLVVQRFEQLERLHAQERQMLTTALDRQAGEYERRLDVLNHAHEAAVKEQARVLPREMHDLFAKEYESFKLENIKQLQSVSEKLVRLTSDLANVRAGIDTAHAKHDGLVQQVERFKQEQGEWRSAADMRAKTWTIAIGGVFAVLGLLLRFWPLVTPQQR